MEATLPSWVKCTDPIPREILEEVRSTVTRWIKNVRNYVEETETYILNDEHTPPEIVDEGWAFEWARDLCQDPRVRYSGDTHRYAEGVYRGKVIHDGWSRFIRRMILSDVNIIHRRTHDEYSDSGYEGEAEDFEVTDIVVGSREENNPGRGSSRRMLRLAVEFHDRLSSEIKDEICSKLASALRALKSRISRICGINELERRVSLAPEAV